MTQINSNSDKSTSFKLSDQVKKTLSTKGYSAIFNYSDFAFYKAQVKKSFNKAQEIAERFIQDNNSKSDFDEYVF